MKFRVIFVAGPGEVCLRVMASQPMGFAFGGGKMGSKNPKIWSKNDEI